MTNRTGYGKSIPIIAIVVAVTALALNVVRKSGDSESIWLRNKVEANIAREFNRLDLEASEIIEAVGSQNPFSKLKSIQSSFYLFDDGNPVYWSKNDIFPAYSQLVSIEIPTYTQWVSGHYLVKKYPVTGTLSLYGVIELYHDTRINNSYLSSGFNNAIFPIQKGYQISQVADGLKINYDDITLFSLADEGTVSASNPILSSIVLILIFGALILMGIWVWENLAERARRGEFESSFLGWISFLIFMRYLMLVFEFPDSIMETGLFGSMFFASSKINPSLGDMLINGFVMMLIALFLFNYYTSSRVLRTVLESSTVVKWFFALMAAVFGYFVIWYPHVVIQTIYYNSQMTLDITQSNEISYPRVVSLLIFVISSFTLFLILYVINRVQIQLFKDNYAALTSIVVIAACLFIGYQVWTSQHFWVVIVTGILFLNILYFTRIYKSFMQWKYQSFIYVFSILSLTSILGSYGIYEFEKDRVLDKKIRFADHFLIKNDNLTEFFLNEANEKIKGDLFIQTRMASPFLSKDIVEEKIRRVYLGSVFDKYEIGINLFSSDGQLLLGDPTEEELKLISNDSIELSAPTEYDDIIFLNRSKGDVVKRYVNKIELRRRDLIVGYITMDFQLKRIIPNDVYFELLVDNQFLEPFLEQDYSYAIYNHDQLTYSSGPFNYLTEFTPSNIEIGSRIFEEELKLGNYMHIALMDMDDRTIVVSSEAYPLEKVITNFSFLFLLQVFILMLIALVYSGFLFYNNVSFSYTARIQLYFNLGFFVPLLVVSTVTLSIMNSTFKEEVRHEHRKNADNISQNITEGIQSYLLGEITKDEFDDRLITAAKFADADVNVFDNNGSLLGTSKPLIYENNLLSTFINPQAHALIVEQRENAWTTEERVGNLAYNVTYLAIKSFRTGELIGVLSVPFFESEIHLDNQQIEVLSTIINIFTIVLIIFLFISYWVSKGLTFPLRLITAKLKKTTLTEHNEPLTWDTDDEIGLMVIEYNKMLENLEDSKRELAKSQKESAWREMAQQVAHEIKNPLTPMKLTLQHLQRKMEATGGKDAEKPINTLLHHVETLDDIATSFSSLAKMPIPENEPFEFVSLLRQTVNLYKNMEGVSIKTDYSVKEVTVHGDKKLMGRIISNILLNAVQSGGQGEKIKIEVVLNVTNRRILLEIKDNGMGIDESIRNKVFVPNFTTKDAGSGIGLAIAKHGIEHAGGKIWFESTAAGSSFFVELPNIE